MLRKKKHFEVEVSDHLLSKKKKKLDPSSEVLGLLKGKDDEETQLESKVFGGENVVLDSLTDRRHDGSHQEGSLRHVGGEGILDAEKPKPVWEDEDDEEEDEGKEQRDDADTLTKQNLTRSKGKQLRQSKFERALGSKPSWAKLKSERVGTADDSDQSEDSSDDEDFIPLHRRTGSYLTTSVALPPKQLDYRTCTDVNIAKRTKKKVTALEFHKSAQVVLVAGHDQTLNLFQVDGEHNPKIQSIFLENFPIFSAHFSADGNEVIMSGEFRWFYSFDMMTGKVNKISKISGISERSLPLFRVSPDGKLLAFRGKYGNIYLLSAKSKEYIATLKMNGRVMDMTFSSNGSRLLSFGDEGNVYIWDVKSTRCVHKFVDDGCLMGTSISVSDNGQFVATGSDSGIVNIYDEDCFHKTNPTPTRIIKNLTTCVTSTKFAPSSEILGVASWHECNAIKMIHLPSCEAFNNFGDNRHQFIRCPTALDFSPNSGYLSVGSSSGRAILFRLNHYDSY